MIRRPATALTAAYVAAAVADVLLAATSPGALAAVHRSLDGAVPRVAVAVVVAVVVGHGLGGAGRAATELWPGLARHRVGVDAAVRFVALAAGIPLAAAVVWPAVTDWWVA
jgi:hypothetical protein